MPSYKRKFIKIYFWQAISFLLNFAALFIVTPLMTNMPEIFGIYTVCVGLNIFLQYADMGFIDAGKKYASESYSKGDENSEKKFIGSSVYIYLIMSLLLITANIIFIFEPALIISDIKEHPDYIPIARKLLAILLVSIPISVVYKYCQLIYSVRLEDYVMQRVVIIGSCIRIASVPFVFFNNRYDIVGYYAFTQIISLTSCSYILYKTRRFNYGILSIFSLVRMDKQSFLIMKGLAFGGFISCLSWFLYYELDTLLISILLGAKSVAIYAIGRNVQSVVRTMVSILYAPYVVRFNYFIGEKDFNGLKQHFINVVKQYSVIIFSPILALSLFAKPFVLAWVGEKYMESVIILQLLVLCFIISYFLSLAGALVYSLNRVKEIVFLSVIQPIVFYLGVLLTINWLGVVSFSLFKLIACIFSVVYYLFIVKRILHLNFKSTIDLLCMNNIAVPSLFCISCSYFILPYFEGIQKNQTSLLTIIMVIIIIILLSWVLSFLLNKEFRNSMMPIIESFKKNYK